MPVTVTQESPNVLAIHLADMVTWTQWRAAQREMEKLLHDDARVSLLAVADSSFRGWEPGEQWQDDSFGRQHEHQFKRLAIVAPREWEDLTLMFAGQGFRDFEISYFESSALAHARKWLGGNNSERAT